METRSLREATEQFMAEHPRHSWTVLREDSHDFAVEIALGPDPLRVAVVRVGGWVVEMTFHGHEETEFVDAEDEVVEALRDALARAVRLTQGPTRLVVRRDGGTIVGSLLEPGIDVGEGAGHADHSWPLRRLKARLLRRPLTEQQVILDELSEN